MKKDARRCSARRKDGQPCQAWAQRDSELALCVAHECATPISVMEGMQDSPDEPAGFYESAYELEKIADQLRAAVEGDLNDELSATRVAVLRLLQQLEETVDGDERARLATLIFRGVGAISGITRTKHAVSQADEEISEMMAEVLREVGDEMGVEL